MNRSCHRIVFNRARGLLMAVAETAAGRTRAPGQGSRRRGIALHAAVSPLRLALWAAWGLVGWGGLAGLAGAQIIADPWAPGAQRPTVLLAPNGVPLVNIQTPSAAGVSRNTYSRFDVARPGVILNNSRTNVQSEMGGWVQGNPWLARGTARVILNEVNSNDPSQLKGYVEVAGQRAQVVIANAAGISCDGCGFINASRATVTTGTPMLSASGDLTGLRVEKGTVTITGEGLDGRGVDYTDIIARAVALDAGVTAHTLAVTAGAQDVALDRAGGVALISARADGSSGGPADPVAIDVSSLGGMYAGSITLVGNGAGVGVRNAGHIGASAGELVVTTDGRLENTGALTASGRARLDAQAGVANAGIVFAKGAVTLSTRGDIDHIGTLAAGGDLQVAATGTSSAIRATADSVLAAGVQDDGRVGSSGRVEALATTTLTAHGRNLAGERLDLSGNQLDLSGSRSQAAAIELQAHAGDIDVSAATMAAGQALSATASQALRTDEASITAAQLQLKAQSLFNGGGAIVQQGAGGLVVRVEKALNNSAGRLGGQGDVDIAAGSIDNRAGLLATGGTLRVDAGSLDNRGGQVQALADLQLTLAETLDNAGGLVRSAQALTVAATHVRNDETQGLSQGLEGMVVRLQAQTVTNRVGAVRADQSLVVGSDDLIDNSGGLMSSGAELRLEPASAEAPRNLAVINRDGTLIAGESLQVDAAGLTGDGKFLSLGDMTLRLSQGYTHTGTLNAARHAILETAGELVNAGDMSAGDTLILKAAGLDNQAAGTIQGERLRIDVSGGHRLVNRGLVDGERVDIDAATMHNVGTGRVYGSRLSIQSNELINESEESQAPVIAARERLDLGVGTLDNREHALIFSGGDMAIGGALDPERQAMGAARAVRNTSATIEALGRLEITARELVNADAHFATEVVTLPAQQVTELAGEGSVNRYAPDAPGVYIYNDESDHLHTPEDNYETWYRYEYAREVSETRIAKADPAKILSGGDMQLHVDRVLNDMGHIVAGGALQVRGDALTNTEPGGQRTTVDAGTVFITSRQHDKGRDSTHVERVAYTPPARIESITLSPSVTRDHATEQGSGTLVKPLAVAPVGAAPEKTGPAATAGVRIGHIDPLVTGNSLFHVVPGSTGRYLVETDPRFASYRQWLGSDYLLDALSQDPAQLQKRLGDGFYEQRLIREQITQLAGRRLLAGFANDEDQFRALMDNGATFARAVQLRPGVALSAEQVAQLTSDIVWLVEQDVTLPDGRAARALVPQVYLRVRDGDLQPSGALMAGRTLDLRLTGDLTNRGTLAGHEAAMADARNIRNLGGQIAGDQLVLRSVDDLDTIGGHIRAGFSLVLDAGRDLHVTSTTASTRSAQGERTSIDRVASLYVGSGEGTLFASAGRDVQLTAASVRSEGRVWVQAGRDVVLGTLEESSSEAVVHDAANYRRESRRVETGTSLHARGDLVLQAGNDLAARAANVTSAQSVQAGAGRDVGITAGEQQVRLDEGHKETSRGFLSSKTIQTRKASDDTTAQSSTFSGRTIEVEAGRDLTLTGSQVVSDDSARLAAGQDVAVQAATLKHARIDERSVRRSGLFSSGGLSVTLGSQQQSTKQQETSTTAAGSTVGSVNGDVAIEAGKTYRQVGSEVLAPRGDIDISAQGVDVVEARETRKRDSETRMRQSGVTVSMATPGGGGIDTVRRMQEAKREAKDPRLQALATLTQGLAIYEAGSQIEDFVKGPGGVNVSISLGSSRSASQTSQASDAAAGSRVVAGADLRARAAGAGADSDILVQGSRMEAGGVVDLAAGDEVRLLAARNESSLHSVNSSSSASVGVSFGVGVGSAGLTVFANASRANGKADGEDVTWTNARVQGGSAVQIASGGDTTLRGAVISAPQVTGRIGGDLVVESLQDTSRYDSQQHASGFGVSIPVSGTGAPVDPAASPAKPAGQASRSNSTAEVRYRSVVEQSGVAAGDGGFDLAVQGRTDLQGGVLGSSEQAAAEGRNRLVTATLTTSDIDNAASAQARSSGGSLTSDMFTRGKYGVTKAVVANTLLNADESRSEQGTTRAAMSAGDVVITDDAGQRALTGTGAVQTVAGLNRDAGSANATVAKPDVEALQRVVEARQAIKEETFRAVTSLTDEVYRSRFEVKPKLLKVECPSGMDCVNHKELLVRTEVTPEEFAREASRETLAVNGILNSEERASQLMYQNTAGKTNEATGETDKPRAIYLVYVAPTRDTLTELMAVAYEKIVASRDYGLANFLGYTNGQEVYAELLKLRGEKPTDSLGHSRGTLVQQAAFKILTHRKDENGQTFKNPHLVVRGVGGAAPVGDYTNAAAAVLGENGNVNNVSYVHFDNDPVSTSLLAGGNPGAWTFKDLWSVWRTNNSMHSCYGSGAQGCTQVEAPLAHGPQGTPEGNARLVTYVGGQRVLPAAPDDGAKK